MKRPSTYLELPAGADPGLGIEAVWTSVAQQASAHRVLPDGRCDIILRFCAKTRPITDVTVVVTGPTTKSYDVPVQPGMGFAGIRLRPSYFHIILGLKPGPLRNSSLIGEAAIMACPALDALCKDAVTPDEFPERLIDFVRSRIGLGGAAPLVQTRQILGALHASSGRLSVHDIARMQGISARSVQRIVGDATGLPPKSYARILQFPHALRLLRDHHLRPSEAAVEAGYADQSHLTHALRQFGGITPAKLEDVTLVTLNP